MAEDAEQASKTEEPSSKRLGDARASGDVPKSPDIPPLLALSAATFTTLIYGGDIARNVADQLLPFIAHPDQIDISGGGAQMVYARALSATSPVLIVLLATGVAGAIGHIVQQGFIWAPGKLNPDFGKLSPIKGLQRLFGIDGLMQSLKSFLKLFAVALITWMIVNPRLAALRMMPGLEVAAILPIAIDILRQVVITVIIFLIAVAGVDWFWQRQRFMARLRMTKEEVKQENKDQDGDPQIKARRRQIQFTRARRRMMQNVPTATLVVMNPTHYAVALRYVQGETPAPVCVAKGMDAVALKIREIAEKSGVAVIEDAPLARALYATVEIEETIPREHYEAVAKIIGFILARARERFRPGRLLPPTGAR